MLSLLSLDVIDALIQMYRISRVWLFAMGKFVSILFFKQKTAYELRISDWSSDVCSSDLGGAGADRAVSFPQGGSLWRARQCRRDPVDDFRHHADGGARAAVRFHRARRSLLVGRRTGIARSDRARA